MLFHISPGSADQLPATGRSAVTSRRGTHFKHYFVIFALVLATAACDGGNEPPPGRGGGNGDFSYTIDESITPSPDTLVGSRLAAVQDEEGNTSLFITDEVLLSPRNETELNDFLARYGGEVIRSNAVPEPPAELEVTLGADDRQATQYTIKLDPSNFALDTFVDDAARAGVTGQATISSQGAAKLLALVTREAASGGRASPNFVFEQQLDSTEEHPQGGGFLDAFAVAQFGVTGSRSRVTDAWNYVDLNPPAQRTYVAIIDAGFWLDGSGNAMTTITGRSDIPSLPLQYDFVQDDYLANGGPCTTGSSCPWHGNNSASVAVGQLNNRYGAAGTGGLVADPMLFKTSLNWDQVARGIRTAAAWGADVISMSFGTECDNIFCDGYFEANLYPALRDARDNGVVMVAAAGNATQWTNSQPCRGDAVICVGALADGTNTKIGYSNFGDHVDIFAPTNIPAMPNPGTGGNLDSAGGTSASTPFVAGVAAMMKAYNPALTFVQVEDILRRTAWTDSPDSDVPRYLNAIGAVRAVNGTSENRPPEINIIGPGDGSSFPRGRQFVELGADANDPDGEAVSVTWESDVDGDLGAGEEVRHNDLSFGDHVVTATAEDAGGLTGQDQVSITITNDPPTVEIIEPSTGASLCVDEDVTFRASVTDLNNPPGNTLPDVAVSWRTTGGHYMGTGKTITYSFDTLGNHPVEVRAADGLGLADEASIAINAIDCSGSPPSVTISAPSEDVTYLADGNEPANGRWYKDVVLEGQATDPEDGTLSGGSLVWRTDRSDVQDPVLGTGNSITVRLYGATGCSSLQHEVTLTATDSDGNERTVVRRITIACFG